MRLHKLVFTEDEYQTLKQVLEDWGCIDQEADYHKVEALQEQFKSFDKADEETPEE
jgi:hypothetical protein